MRRVAVIGAGFGGLGAALARAHAGDAVTLYEALRVPGGCASSFQRGGLRFDAGATLTAGLAPDGLFTRRLAQHGLHVALEAEDAFTVETPDGTFCPAHDREAWVASLCALAPARAAGVRAWCAAQAQIADALWPLFADPDLLPPVNRAWWRHVTRLMSYARLIPWVSRSLGAMLGHYGLRDQPGLRRVIDGLCQITVQGDADHVDAITACAAIDYGWRGVGTPVGGMGTLAEALAEACRRVGADVRMPDRVHHVRAVGDGWQVTSRSGIATYDAIVLNVLPADADALLGRSPVAPPTDGWGAAMHYLGVRDDPTWACAPRHAVLCDTNTSRNTHGHQVFASLAARDASRPAGGRRALTLSTHLAANADADEVAAVQATMLKTLHQRWPELSAAIEVDHPASPRTFTRFVRRSGGYVGGPVRRPSWDVVRQAFPTPIAPGVWRVGDSNFPGQSTLATFVGGERVAAALGALRR